VSGILQDCTLSGPFSSSAGVTARLLALPMLVIPAVDAQGRRKGLATTVDQDLMRGFTGTDALTLSLANEVWMAAAVQLAFDAGLRDAQVEAAIAS
jgi:hypothetical protein